MKRYLLLADGTVYEGQAAGADGEVIGEVVFTTAMVGYMETLTDPSYYGQIVTQTFPLIGNYGAVSVDSESEKPELKGYIVRELCDKGSNFRMDSELNDFLCAQNIVAIQGIDTRSLTRKIRECGVMNGMLTDSLKNREDKLKKIRQYRVKDAVGQTTCKQVKVLGEGGSPRVVLWDFGAKQNIERELLRRGCEVLRVPAFYTAEQIMALKPQGIMLTNGGGDPAENKALIAELKKLNEYRLPTFGICLGHQLLALSHGAKTKKLKYGHRGANQPVRDTQTGKVYITSQNHGYAVVAQSLPDTARLSYTNANDKTCEGVEYSDYPAFSVQFHPEACGGPKDTGLLFDRFIDKMREQR